MRSEHLNALQSRTELESLMRMCLDDVKQDIMRQRSRTSEEMAAAGGGVAAMGREDRMKVRATPGLLALNYLSFAKSNCIPALLFLLA